MRHRDEPQQASQAGASQSETRGPDSTGTLTQLMVTQQLLPGKHRAPLPAPRIPAQALPTHDSTPVTPAAAPQPFAAAKPAAAPVAKPAAASATATTPENVPLTAHWKASHLPRTVAAATLAVAVVGTAALGVRYAQTRTSDDFISLVIGLGVVVVLWAVVIASTPQVVSVEGSVLTVHNTGGSTKFDLADALQPIDVVGNARTSHWAVLLHRPDSTTLVLRRNDVIASELDPIVRHYRMVADQRHAERDARFER